MSTTLVDFDRVPTGADAPAGSGFVLDLERMQRERRAKLSAALDASALDGLVLFGPSNVAYVTGAERPLCDAGLAYQEPLGVIVGRDGLPHVFTPFPELVPSDIPAGNIHPPLLVDFEEGVAHLAAAIGDVLGSGALSVGIDDETAAMHAHLGRLAPRVSVLECATVLGAAKICKTSDEIECIRRAQYLNECAMQSVYAALRPGMRQCDLSGLFLRRIFELGATGNVIDPIFQVTPLSKAFGPSTTNGDLAFPLCSSDRILREGELMFVDTGIVYHGYASDFGRTWLVGKTRPDARQEDQFKRYREVIDTVLALVRPGTTGLDLVRAAPLVNGRKPWLDHFYLAHGIGTESAEMPLIGTDLGEDFDASIVLAPGMVMVLEPVIWDDGHGGYRSEEIIAVTDDGYRMLTDFPYTPFGDDTASGGER